MSKYGVNDIKLKSKQSVKQLLFDQVGDDTSALSANVSHNIFSNWLHKTVVLKVDFLSWDDSKIMKENKENI